MGGTERSGGRGPRRAPGRRASGRRRAPCGRAERMRRWP